MEHVEHPPSPFELADLNEWVRRELAAGKCGHRPSSHCKHRIVLFEVERTCRAVLDDPKRYAHVLGTYLYWLEGYREQLSIATTLRILSGGQLSPLADEHLASKVRAALAARRNRGK